jgi:hypothetical protein
MVGQHGRAGEATTAAIGPPVQAAMILGRTDANAQPTTDAMAAGRRVVATTKTQNLLRARRVRLKKPDHLVSPKRGANHARAASRAPGSPGKRVNPAGPKSLKTHSRLKNSL